LFENCAEDVSLVWGAEPTAVRDAAATTAPSPTRQLPFASLVHTALSNILLRTLTVLRILKSVVRPLLIARNISEGPNFVCLEELASYVRRAEAGWPEAAGLSYPMPISCA